MKPEKWCKKNLMIIACMAEKVVNFVTILQACWSLHYEKGRKFTKSIPIEGDLKGYFSGKSTRTFHTPPSYGAEGKKIIIGYHSNHIQWNLDILTIDQFGLLKSITPKKNQQPCFSSLFGVVISSDNKVFLFQVLLIKMLVFFISARI